MNEKAKRILELEAKFENMSIAQLIVLFGKSENDGLLEVVLNKKGYSFETSEQIWIAKKYSVYKSIVKECNNLFDDIYSDSPSIKEENFIIARDMTLSDAEELVVELQKVETDKNTTYSYEFDRF